MAQQTTGHGIKVTFSQDATLVLHATATTDFGVELDDMIDQSHNDTELVREYAPGDLMKVEAVTWTCKYDETDYSKALAIIGIEGIVTVTHVKSGKAIPYPACWLAAYKPQEASGGSTPEVQIRIENKGGSLTNLGTWTTV